LQYFLKKRDLFQGRKSVALFGGLKKVPENSERKAIEDAYLADETDLVENLIKRLRPEQGDVWRTGRSACALVEAIRKRGAKEGGFDAFLQEYDMSSREGVILMCLAESLLRVPDPETADRLIKDKITEADWERHLGKSESIFVNASTWALMLSGRLIEIGEGGDGGVPDIHSFLRRMAAKSGEGVVRRSLVQAMRLLGQHFVLGQTIEEAMVRALEGEKRGGERYSYDMLGEAALSAVDAERYMVSYLSCIAAVGKENAGRGTKSGPGVSVKLSALHPRYAFSQRERVLSELLPRLKRLALEASRAGIGLCVDAEEAERLGLSLDVFELLCTDPELSSWDGLGLAVQAYQKRALPVIDWLASLAERSGRRIMVRLVKGAYWDSEIKQAQEKGLLGYPVFTRKAATDVSYLACARAILSKTKLFYPQFATHNAHTVAAVLEMAAEYRDFEFQRLHGMGESLYEHLAENPKTNVPCRIYAPVGGHEDLLSYLVRRLLENGANTSFVNRLVDAAAPVSEVASNPLNKLAAYKEKPHPKIPLPRYLYGPDRLNSKGLDLADEASSRRFFEAMNETQKPWCAAPVTCGQEKRGGKIRKLFSPADGSELVGTVKEATKNDVKRAMAVVADAAPVWDDTPAAERAACLERAADMLEEDMPALAALCVSEGGKTINDAISEVREAVDFCRYYAFYARTDFGHPEALPATTGEKNRMTLHGRGVFVCISPWNFPLAIFLGQVVAALAAGNAVIAKPAAQTPLVGARAVDILHRAGVPEKVLHFLPGRGAVVGAALVCDPNISGVAFTGSVETARTINQALAARDGPIVPLIAETGGQNVMIVDSTALPEQVIKDVLSSAFNSAGQRCSALRVLFLQSEIADSIIRMLSGAMAELKVGHPAHLSTDVGPVINAEALRDLEKHAKRMDRQGELICRTSLAEECEAGTFCAPAAYKIDSLELLEGEVFGPLLHVIVYRACDLDKVITAVNGTGFGLTLGVHSRIESTAKYIHQRIKVGNTYVNRNMIGAVVGAQPFGGEGLSGTGPKAGGPRYLHRFATERVLSVNTAAAGGDAALLSLDETGP
jgi:RHH-type transcriptional regulator, proline utilization regulon repressor / proline dehydrogenase / delta 1-pyrroline-5-carboxylate dehydrogenase